MADQLRPVSLKREGDGLKIEWTDGVVTFATWRHIRAHCPCAACIEDRSKPPDPFRVLSPQEAAAGPLAPVAMKPVGHYAYQITWNDGHSTGIYPVERLRELSSNQLPGSPENTMNPQMPPKLSLPGVKNVIAVASGKGGVGKSTVAANLAVALRMSGKAVGLMDADIYGPSVPIMFGLGTVDPQQTPFPLEKYGVKLMSMGFMVSPEQAVIWRGPKVAQAVQAFLGQINWGDLDYLVIDLPPGTGDAQLTLSQSAPLTGAVIVTTPGEVSLIDARKGVKMFREVRVPILGIVENMSHFEDATGKKTAIFGVGGGMKLALESNVPFLGELPIDPRVAECGDGGEPIVRKCPDSPVAKAYLALAQTVAAAADKPQAEGLPEVQL